MNLKVRSLIACCLCAVIIVAKFYPNTVVTSWIPKIVYSTQDFAAVRQLLKKEEPIQLFVFDDKQPTAKHFKTIKPSEDGFLLTYKNPITVFAPGNGVVIYSAHTAHAGKSMIVAYDNGYTAHYAELTTIHKLPYTTVVAGERIATVDGGQLYIALFKKGAAVPENLFIRWIHHGL